MKRQGNGAGRDNCFFSMMKEESDRGRVRYFLSRGHTTKELTKSVGRLVGWQVGRWSVVRLFGWLSHFLIDLITGHLSPTLQN